jgi:hypothetical protein
VRGVPSNGHPYRDPGGFLRGLAETEKCGTKVA